MSHVVEGLGAAERERIAAWRRDGTFFWLDVSLADAGPDDLSETLGVPEHVLRPLLAFGRAGVPSRGFLADGEHVVFTLVCYPEPHLESPVEVHVLVTGDYLLTLHETPVSLRRALALEAPEGGSERYTVYAVLDAIVGTAFDALTAVELKLEDLLTMSTDLRRVGRARLADLPDIGARLSAMRRQVAPQRAIFERIGVEIGRLKGLEPDVERYFERIGEQANRLVEGIDAAANAMATLIDLRLNETTYWLTVVATIFLPLTFITGFFGMNFGWMVREVNTALAFWLLGVGSLIMGVALIWRLVVRGSPTG
jgi:magnesium transporter